MDESALRELIDDVRRGRLGRRAFVQTMVALGLTAPMAVSLLGPGRAQGEPRDRGFIPTRRGGGGDLKMLMWDAPTLLHPHFGRGLRDYTASRIFYEPLAAVTPEGTFAPVLADELPSVRNGTVAPDGQWVLWKLKRNVTWHDGAPFTSSDVIFNWEFAADPTNATTTRGAFEEIARIDRIDSHTVKVVYKKPQPFWARTFVGDGLLPRHVFEKHRGAGAREAFGMQRAVGTGPYRLVDFKPGDMIRAEINPNYHIANRPFFDRLEIKGGGDAVSAARAVLQTGEYDFGYYILAEDDMLKRLEQGGGKGRILIVPGSGISHIQCNMADPWREVDGERPSPRSTHPILSEAPVRTALSLLVDRASIQEHVTGRAGQLTANFLNAPDRFRSRNTTWEFNVDKANQILDGAGWTRGADGVRVKDSRRLKLVFQSALHASVQKVQQVFKQSAAKAGVEIEIKAVPTAMFFSSDTSSPDSNVRFLADLQMYTTFTGLDPQFFMAQFASWEIPGRDNKWTGRNLTRWKNAEYDRLWRQAETEMDPVKRAALFIRMNDLVIQDAVVIPVTLRNILHAASNQLGGIELDGWDSIFGKIAYWHRLG